MFSHVILGSNDLDRSFAFYSTVLAPLGGKPVLDNRAGGWLGFRVAEAPGDPITGRRPSLWICRPIDGAPATVGNGVNVAFDAPDRAAVDAAHAAALALGAPDLGAPGLRPIYHPNFYGAYARDPDGHKLCFVCHRRPPG